MSIEEMKKRKAELGLTSEMISQMSGVPLGTVQKIFNRPEDLRRNHQSSAQAYDRGVGKSP